MTKFAASFSFGFAGAILLGAAMLFVIKDAQARDDSLNAWVVSSPDAKLAHARQVARNLSSPNQDGGELEAARQIMFCLHDVARSAGDRVEPRVGSGRTGRALNEAVETCRDSVERHAGTKTAELDRS
jgi:hypothetical protein